ncbi:MAG: TldD protein [Pseudomonadota bacterium]
MTSLSTDRAYVTDLPAPRSPARVLPVERVERLLSEAMARGADFAEVYAERTVLTSLSLDEGVVRSGHGAETAGVGVRVVVGSQVGYAYSDDLDDEALLSAARTAARIARGSGEPPPVKVSRRPAPEYYRIARACSGVPLEQKVALLLRLDGAARSHDPRIRQVTGSYVDSVKNMMVANTRGHLALDLQDMARLHAGVVAIGGDGERRTGAFGGGGRVGFDHFDTFTPEAVGREAARQAIAMMGAVDAPAGPQTVVLAPGWSGILLHEAVGHGLEADFIRKGTSLFAGKLGERVASDLVTVIDDGTLSNGRGSVNVDDEGVPGQRKVLIENGILKGYLYDTLNAGLMGAESTGSGRRESFRHAPLPRMTNTFLAPGESDPREVVASVRKGLYAAQFGGGQVDITNGNFVFEVAEAYLIEDGRLTRPVKGATLIGVGPTALKQVSMVGNDPRHDPGMGTCGKNGQSVPVGVGLPTLRIDDLTVGGTRV